MCVVNNELLKYLLEVNLLGLHVFLFCNHISIVMAKIPILRKLHPLLLMTYCTTNIFWALIRFTTPCLATYAVHQYDIRICKCQI